MKTNTREMWFHLTTIGPDDDIDIPFDCEGNSVIVRLAGQAFIMFESPLDCDQASATNGVRPVDQDEATQLNLASLAPDVIDDQSMVDAHRNGRWKLGDSVSRLLARLGFSSCAECDQRRIALNRISF